MKIGVTERGDAGLDFSWVDKLNTVDGAIIITKNLNNRVVEEVIKNIDKVILHITCTGWGNTTLEPNVPKLEYTVSQAKKLIAQIPENKKNHIILRLDPIIPTIEGVDCAYNVLNSFAGIVDIVRVSIIDMYPHVRERFDKLGIEKPYGDGFSPPAKQIKQVNNLIKQFSLFYNFEACAEPLVTCKQIGCVSNNDLEKLGLEKQDETNKGFQRKGCLCLPCKTELLESKTRCPHKCVYCYWKD